MTCSGPEQVVTTPAPLVRSPVFVLRAVAGGLVFVVGLAGLLWFEQGLLGFRADVAALQERWPDIVVTAIEALLVAVLAMGIVGTNVVLLVRRRYRRVLLINAAAAVAVLLGAVAGHAVLAVAPSDALMDAIEDPAANGLGNDLLASVVAVVTIATPWIGERLRSWTVGFVAAALGMSLLGGAIAVITLPFDIGVGLLAGASVALAVRTRNRTPTPTELASTLRSVGVDPVRVDRASVDARGSVPWFVRTADGGDLFVKTLGTDQRAADLLFRLYRVARLRRSGDHRPFSSLRRAAEHEAFLSLAADARGVPTPGLVAVSGIGTDGMLLAYQRVAGRSLDAARPNDLTDAVLASIWLRIVALRRAGIAHRDLRLANVFLDDDGEVWLIDFGFAELAAGDQLLARDVAELLASTAAEVGRQRAVAAAVDVLGVDAIATAIPWIQPLALSSATSHRVGGRAGCQALRNATAQVVGAQDTSVARLARVGPWSPIVTGSGVRRRARGEPARSR